MPDDITLSVLPNNRDATFKKRTKKQKPTDLLLHYNYGATAVKWWGQGLDILQKRSHPPRPPVPVQAKAGPSRTRHDSTVTIDELDAVRGDGVGAGGAGTSGVTVGNTEMVDSEGQAKWDEDDVMLFLWGNSKAAKDRYHKENKESTQDVDQWRQGVSQVS